MIEIDLDKISKNELAKYIKTLEETSNHIFANVNDDELLISNAMNWKEKETYKQALLDIKEKLERDIENTKKDIKDNSVSSKYFHNPYGLMFAKGCVSKSKELLDIVNKAIGE